MHENYQDIIKKWREKRIQTREDYIQSLSSYSIVFAYNSGVIENPEVTYHNTREIFENGKVVNFTGDLRTLYEIENQKKCYEFILDKISDKAPISRELILQIHKKLTQGTYDENRWNKGERPGTFKVHDYCVADGQGALPDEVPGEIDELCEELVDIPDKGDNIFKAAAYIHCKFENIHPFADGNGRVGRTLMNYFLMTHNYPPLIVYNATKDKYYAALGHYDKTGDVSKFVDYMKDSMEQTWEIKPTQENKLENLIDRSGETEQQKDIRLDRFDQNLER
ncbi:Fic family protein [Roseburia sp. BX0805]|uniref:Fic family protein n=1 Tax=Roseburia yibonii TaxID=2763063 RepID=A0ABR7IDU7_9FIRM|nr:Fic family protein [Roseburia yibonii]MBC5754969.1 Fic family protein [Roseburia yibonii]